MALDDVQSLVKEIKAEHQSAFDKVKEIAEQAVSEAKKGNAMTDDLKGKTDEALTIMNGFKAQIDALEQKMSRATNDGDQQANLSLGAQFVAAENVKNFLASDSKRGKVELMLKATISSSTTATAGSAGAALNAERIPGIVTPNQRRMTVRNLLTAGTMSQSSIEYVRETGFNNNAAPVAELAAKPQSDLRLELFTSSARVIAHHSKASRQMLDDVPMLQSYIDGRLRYGLEFKEEVQLLSGDGTGQNLLGIIPQATASAAAFAPAAETPIDKIRLGMLQAALAEYPATATVMHPTDWARIELTKDSEGRYIIGNPAGMLTPTLWALPVVATQAIGVDKFLTGAFQLGAQIFDRWTARVEIATENEDDFVKNMVTMLCEERIALAVYRPESFIYGDLGFVV
jgi:HK97 family phage major capsid protein